MTDLLPILYGLGELVVVMLLLSILRASAGGPKQQPEDLGSHDEPFEQDPFDTSFDDEEPRPSLWNKHVH